jgi:GNAT superfamily N-acetyltransferase
MADQGPATVIRLATPRDDLAPLANAALARARVARGGRALVEQVWGCEPNDEQVAALVAREVADAHVWVADASDVIIGAALVRHGCVEVLWVVPSHRRQGVATAVVRFLLDLEDAPRDAWALPGDRATKSLYESVGWKARLLTMRGA